MKRKNALLGLIILKINLTRKGRIMTEYTANKIEKLYTLTVKGLMDEYYQLTGETYFTHNRQSLIRKVAWLYQTRNIKPISQLAKNRIDKLIIDSRLRTKTNLSFNIDVVYNKPKKKKVLPIGTVLTRTYKGKLYEVLVVENGFIWNNTIYKSISAVAKAITRKHWNGKSFFGLK